MHCKSLLLHSKLFTLKLKSKDSSIDVFNKNVYDVIKQRSLFGFEERKKEVNYMDAKYLEIYHGTEKAAGYDTGGTGRKR